MKEQHPLYDLNESIELLGLEDVTAEYAKHTTKEISMISLARDGLNVKSLDYFSNKVSLPRETLAYLLHTSSRNLRRYSKNDKLNASISEKLLLLADIYQIGISIFGSSKLFNKWMEEPNLQFEGEKPLKILDTFIGYRMVQDELIKIEHGIFA